MHKYDLREREIQERPHFDKYKVGEKKPRCLISPRLSPLSCLATASLLPPGSLQHQNQLASLEDPLDLISTRSFQLSALSNHHPVPTTAELDIIVDRLVPFTEDRLIVWIGPKMSVMMGRAVSEVREGLCEGDGGFDLVLAEKKEQVGQRW